MKKRLMQSKTFQDHRALKISKAFSV
ncbi:hypothetical protein B4U80_02065 [Leptotrombidium deliense]|uniref:Uncharacterized protein n=1 Tax=Leptotrombidium deliense TaxID=299467 RepID=A0A443S022_9ACAR|nr:hypothetical protein B4U80_02065 [Leptotrombidium deliense]